MLPFDKAQFFQVFADYNLAVWPAQAIAYLAAWAALVLSVRREPVLHRLVWVIVAALWAWTGFAYHGLYFAEINPIARVFAAAFVLQAALLAYYGGARGAAPFGRVEPHRAILGWTAIVYATVLYPAVGVLNGHDWPAMPTFGVTPCPLVIFTFGLLLLTPASTPRLLLAIPLAWAIVGGSAAVVLDVPQDWMLPLAGAALLVDELRRARTARGRPPQTLSGINGGAASA